MLKTLILLVITIFGVSYALDEIEQKAFLNQHNIFRRQLLQGSVPNQPKAATMPDLIYDSALEASAQKLANTCVFNHDTPSQRMPPSKDPKYGGYVGQNIFKSWSSNPSRINATAAVPSWWSEYQFFNFSTNKCAVGKQCGHYTQIAWSKTSYLGCAKMNCPIDSTRLASVMVVCNYAQGGNYVGQRPYVAA